MALSNSEYLYMSSQSVQLSKIEQVIRDVRPPDPNAFLEHTIPLLTQKLTDLCTKPTISLWDIEHDHALFTFPQRTLSLSHACQYSECDALLRDDNCAISSFPDELPLY